jgi:hypothetical protein
VLASDANPAPRTPPSVPGAAADPRPLRIPTRGWTWWLGLAITAAILVAVIIELRNVDFARVRAMLPASPAFWLAFAAMYFAGPAADWTIYRRLWRIPAAGFAALLRKLVGNELLFGYAGELYLYTWARRHTEMTSAPFAAIKDVAILSAMTANAVTLVLLALAWPLLASLNLGLDTRTLLVSVAIVVTISSAVLLFRNKLFSLPAADLRAVAGIHFLRILATTLLAALCWHLVLPQVALSWWLLLATLRMLLSRLPLLPNKDIVFAGLAVFLVGHDAEIAALMTMMASLILTTHLGVGLSLVAAEATAIGRR